MDRSKKRNRREFLQGCSARERMAEQIEEGAFSTEVPSSEEVSPVSLEEKGSAQGGILLHISRPAMACEFEVIINAVDQGRSTEAALEALDWVDRLEDQMSVYRDESEVSELNRSAWQAPQVVEEGLFHLLSLAKSLHEETEGAFDITAAPLSRIWGFHRRAGRIPSPEEIEQAKEKIGSEHLQLDASTNTLFMHQEGIEINLGGIGKGYALDCAAQHMEGEGIADFLLHGGKSSLLARGKKLHSAEPSEGWLVGVGHPLRPERRLATITLKNQAIGTSGSGTQSFHHRGKRYGHILDPRTGWPAEQVLSATVVAPSAAEADALATACYVLGSEGARSLCDERDETALLLVERGERAGSIQVYAEGFSEGAVEFLEEGASPRGG